MPRLRDFEEVKVRAFTLFKQGCTIQAISKRLDVRAKTVSDWLDKAGLAKKGPVGKVHTVYNSTSV